MREFSRRPHEHFLLVGHSGHVRLAARILAIVLVAAVVVGIFALLAEALRAPDPTVPPPIQIREGSETPPKDRPKNRPRKPKKERRPKEEDEGARPVAPAPPPAGADDDAGDGDPDTDDGETED